MIHTSVVSEVQESEGRIHKDCNRLSSEAYPASLPAGYWSQQDTSPAQFEGVGEISFYSCKELQYIVEIFTAYHKL